MGASEIYAETPTCSVTIKKKKDKEISRSVPEFQGEKKAKSE